MRHYTVTADTLPEAYHQSLGILKTLGDIVDCPDWSTTQKEVSMTMVVDRPLCEPMISRLFIGGPKDLEQYCQEMLDGILDFEVNAGKWSYTYHDRMRNYGFLGLDQYEFVLRELRRNKYSRRAVINFRNTEEDLGSEDPACLQHIQYFIRNNIRTGKDELHCHVLFRSNDACKATFMNAFALIMLQKKIADELGVSVGQYVHTANSFHCYERDFEMLDGYCKRINSSFPYGSGNGLTYRYKDGWDELMEEAKSEIAEMLKNLKGE